jgi:hypothetical protein
VTYPFAPVSSSAVITARVPYSLGIVTGMQPFLSVP